MSYDITLPILLYLALMIVNNKYIKRQILFFKLSNLTYGTNGLVQVALRMHDDRVSGNSTDVKR